MFKPYLLQNMIYCFDGELLLTLEDHIRYKPYCWPVTLVSYSVDFSKHPVDERCILITNAAGEAVPSQLSEQRYNLENRLIFGVISFYAELGSGEHVEFLVRDGKPPAFSSTLACAEQVDCFVAGNDNFKIKLPKSQLYPAFVPGPVLAVNSGSGWFGSSQIVAPSKKIVEISTTLKERGELFVKYTIDYFFEHEGKYSVTITVYSELDFFDIYEETSNFEESENAYFRLNFNGFDPSHRYSPNNPGELELVPEASYEEYPWQRIDEDYNNMFNHPMDLATHGKNGELPFRLSVFETQGSVARNKCACFWNEHTSSSVGIFVRKSELWNDYRYDIFTSWDGFAVSYFYESSLLWWKFPIVNSTRCTAVAIYNHEKDKRVFDKVKSVLQMKKSQDFFEKPVMPFFATAYISYLENWYNTLSLDRIKEFKLTYPKDAKRLDPICSYAQYDTPQKLIDYMFTYIFIPSLAVYGSSINVGFSGVPYRRMLPYFESYQLLFDKFTQEQRERVEAVILLMLNLAQTDLCVPLFSMLGGPPNLLADVKRCLGTAANLFPEHPQYLLWAQTFDKFLEMTSEFSVRPPLPALGLKGGRWTENIGTYVWAYLQHVQDAHAISRILNGRENAMANTNFAMLGDWLVHCLTAPFDGENPLSYELNMKNHRFWEDCKKKGTIHRRMHPPQGAHSARRLPPNAMWLLALNLERFAPMVSENLRWVSNFDDKESESSRVRSSYFDEVYTKEKRDRGTRPEFKTTAYTGYGVILRSGVDTQDEISVHLQQIDEGPNYRWGVSGMGGNGQIFYYANGKAYSHVGGEHVGDFCANDCDYNCAFGVWKGHTYRTIGQNVLMNGYFDMDSFQYTKLEPENSEDSYAYPEYQSRSITLSHSDYILIHDAVANPDIKTRFSWSVGLYDEMPYIHRFSTEFSKSELKNEETKVVWYNGKGDSRAVVTHKENIFAEGFKHGVVVSQKDCWVDTVFTAGKVIRVCKNDIAFQGKSASVRVYEDTSDFGGDVELVLFDGSLLQYKDITIQTNSFEPISVSLKASFPDCMSGKIKTYGKGKVKIGIESCEYEIFTDGIRAVTDENGFFDVSFGEHQLCVTFNNTLPIPNKPSISKVINGNRKAVAFWEGVGCCDFYEVLISEDFGKSFKLAQKTINHQCCIDNLVNGRKYHISVVAVNKDKNSEPSHEYPVYVTDKCPISPEGLKISFAKVNTNCSIKLSWGQILNVAEYVLYRKDISFDGDFTEIYRGTDTEFICGVDIGKIYEYKVSAANLNGEGSASSAVNDDKSTLVNWHPDKYYFDRNSLYNHHPFTCFNSHKFKSVAANYPESVL